MRKVFEFGKIAYTGKKKINTVTVEVELRSCGGEATFTVGQNGERHYTGEHTPTYVELSICGYIWNAPRTEIVCGGQCLEEIAKYKNQLEDKSGFEELYELWQNYHLNGMHAGTPEQEAAIAAWEAQGNKYDYDEVCDMLKALGLYAVNYTGLSVGRRYENEMYKYGHGWLVQELPGDVLIRVEHLLST